MEINVSADELLSGNNVARAQQAGRRRDVAGDGKEKAQARKVAQEFEALFIGMMLKSMRSTVGEDKLLGGGHGEEMYRSLLDQEYATAAARRGGLGLAAIIEKGMALPAPPDNARSDKAETGDLPPHDAQ